MNYTSKFVEFLNGANTIIIGGERDFNRFKALCKRVGLDFNYENYWDLLHIAEINNYVINYSTVLVEYQPYKGFSGGYKTFEDSEKWYGQSPWALYEIYEDFK